MTLVRPSDGVLRVTPALVCAEDMNRMILSAALINAD